MHQLGLPVRRDNVEDIWFLLTQFSMGFARLAESWIRKAQGKTESDGSSALEKIAASTIGGALATWNQPIEVVRVEVSLFGIQAENDQLPRSNSPDAIHVQGHCQREPTRQADHSQHSRLHLQGKRHQRSLPRCYSSHWPRYLADCVHGFVCGLCQGLD